MSQAEQRWKLGQRVLDGLPVIYSVVEELPDHDVRARFRWLTVIKWAYDGKASNGMPPADANDSMLRLDHALEPLGAAAHLREAYRRTGNGLKEFAFYIADRDQFMAAFNAALRSHPRYPIEIDFYEDPEWSDLRMVLDAFGPA